MGKGRTGDAGLAAAAHCLVERALGVVPGERVLIVHDAPRADIAEVIAEAVRHARSEPVMFALEALAERPHAHLDPRIVAELPACQASLILIDFHAGELLMRTELVDSAAKHKLRHGHMVGVSRASIVAGFAVDPYRISERARSLAVRLRPNATIRVRSAAGTDLVVTIAPRCRWIEFGNTVAPGRRVNLPGGELVTSPESVSGVYMADGTLGDAAGELRRSLAGAPVRLRVTSSRVTAVDCDAEPRLARQIRARLTEIANLDRVGLIGFGLNVGISAPVGDIFTDQKVPGVHLSLGETFPDKTGAPWNSKSWVGFTVTRCDADIDDLPILRGGRYLV